LAERGVFGARHVLLTVSNEPVARRALLDVEDAMNEIKSRTLRAGSLLGLVLGSTVLASTMLAGTVLAQDNKPPAPEVAVRAAMADHFFERMDTNKDGQVTRAEADAVEQQLFARLDADKDGVLTAKEAEDGGRALRAQELEARFKALDGNGDGKLDQPESKLPPAVFERLDQNKDHALTLVEFVARPDRRAQQRELEFEQADATTTARSRATRPRPAPRLASIAQTPTMTV
jgi:EF hand domain-containing protein